MAKTAHALDEIEVEIKTDENSLLGEGAFSSVHRGVREDGRAFAIKRISATPFGSAENAYKQAVLEASTLSRLNSPHIARVESVGLRGDSPYLVMELVNGKSLARFLNGQNKLSLDDLLALAISVTEGLTHVHQLGLVHRDIKPDNILLHEDQLTQAKIIDFGLALRGDENSPGSEGSTTHGAAVGTLHYASPEQTRMLSRPVDARSDLYSLGVVLYECAAGTLPFHSDSIAELLRMHLSEDPKPLTQHRSDLPPGFCSIVHTLLSKDPDDRFQSAAALLKVLRNFHSRKNSAIALADRGAPVFPETPFVGRETEVSAIEQALSAAFAPHSSSKQTLLISGSAGSGKSRLIREMLRKAEEQDAWTLQGKCTPSDSTSFSPFIQAIDRFILESEFLEDSKKQDIHRQLQESVQAQPIPGVLNRFGPRLRELMDRLGTPLGEAPPSIQQERMLELLAQFIASFSSKKQKVVWLLDDLQWMDELSGRLLLQVQSQTQGLPFLWAITSRDDEESQTRLETFKATSTNYLALSLQLQPLRAEATQDLISRILGSTRSVPTELVSYIRGLSQGNPFATSEYVRAMLDDALLVPKWSQWVADMQGIQGLQLAGDVIGLVTRRLEGLTELTLEVLKNAAVCGNSFALTDLPQSSGLSSEQINGAITEAAAKTLIARSATGDWIFVHDRVREAVLSRIAKTELPQFHWKLAHAIAERISEPLTSLARKYDNLFGHQDPSLARALNLRDIQALATHVSEGLDSESTDRETLWAFEQLRMCTWFAKSQSDHSLVENFGTRAIQLLERLSAERLTDREAAARLCWVTGSSLAILGHLSAASEIFEAGLKIGRDPLTRASLSSQYSYVALWRYDSTTLEKRSLATLAEFGILGKSGVWLQMKLAAFMVQHTILQKFSPSAERVRKMELVGLAFETLGIAMAYQLRSIPALLSVPAALSLLMAPIRNDIKGNLAGIVLIGSRIFESEFPVGMIAERVARRVDSSHGDQTYHATNRYNCATSLFYKDATGDFPRHMMECAEKDKNFNALGNHLNYFIVALFSLFFRGLTRDLKPYLEAVERTRSLIPDTEKGQRSVNIFAITPQAPIFLGDFPQAAREIQDYSALLGTNQDEHTREALRIQTQLLFFLEQREFSAEMEKAISRFRALPFDLFWIALNYVRFATALIGYIRLEQLARETDPALRKHWLNDLQAEMKRIGSLRDLLTAPHREVLRAGLLFEQGKIAKAKTQIAKAEKLATRHQNDWVLFECTKIKLRMGLRQGTNPSELQVDALKGLHYALRNDWKSRVELFRTEFAAVVPEMSFTGAPGKSTPSFDSRTRMDSESHSIRTALAARQLQALLEVSLASAESLNPEIQIQKIMQSLTGILGAERTILFLTHPDTGKPELSASYTKAEGGPKETTGYSTQVVEKVFQTRSALVISGDDDAKAIGSQSAIRWGLRSIIAAPLLVQERLIGVIYLDSRLAKGVFTQANLEILQALSQHIAITLETSRAAKLELERVTLEKEAAFQREIQGLLDNLSQAVFSVDSQGKVVAPVSQFTRTIFGDELPGKDIFETVFKDIPQNSEALAKTRSALALVYGEDSFQWDFAEGDLMRQVTYHHPDKGERILRFDYKPFWNSEDRLDRLMFVIEDATDLIALEKEVAIAKAENEKRMRMLGELADVKSQFLTDFFKSGGKFIDECRMTLQSPEFRLTREGKPLLLRNLHTLKGNARLCHLSGISTVVHEVENEVLSLLIRDQEKTITPEELLQLLHQEMDRGEAEFTQYLSLASRIFGIQDERKNRGITRLHEALLKLESMGGTAAAPSFVSEISQLLSAVDPSLRTLGENWIQSPTAESFQPFAVHAAKRFAAEGLFSGISLDSAEWSQLFEKSFKLLQNLTPEAMQETRAQLFSSLQRLGIPSLARSLSENSTSLPREIWGFLRAFSEENIKRHYTRRSLQNLVSAVRTGWSPFCDGQTRRGARFFEFLKEQAAQGLAPQDVLAQIARTLHLPSPWDALDAFTSDASQTGSLPPLLYSGWVDHSRLLYSNNPNTSQEVTLLPVLENTRGMIRELSDRLGKKVRCEIAGESVLLDPNRVSLLSDALVHLIRNSLDHGLETPEERSQQGKTEEGTLELECFLTQDQNLSISLRDDGRGIDGEKILKKALQGGKISLSAAEKLSPQERQELIYLPSFSTKEVATDLSGRGVGMDVVKSNIETLGGRLILNSTLGKGTEFVILINPRTERLTT